MNPSAKTGSVRTKNNTDRKSRAWNYFTKVDEISARCKFCSKVLKHKGNTTNLMQHVDRMHYLKTHMQTSAESSALQPVEEQESAESSESTPSSFAVESIDLINNNLDIAEDLQSQFSDSSQNSQSSTTSSTSARQTSQKNFTRNTKSSSIGQKIDESFAKMRSYKQGGKTALQITNAILYMIAVDHEPLSIVEHKGFQNLIRITAPLYALPSRKTITKLLDERYNILRAKFKTDIEEVENFCLTTDVWTDNTTKSYLGITLHYMTNNTMLTKAIIGVVPLSKSHTASYLGTCLLDTCYEYSIDIDKITAVVTDNGSNIVAAVNQSFGNSKQLPCFAHTLALIYPSAMKVSPELTDILHKVKSIVTLTRQSVVASDELRRLQQRDGKKEGTILKFKQDCPTRWNSTFYMVERFLKLKDYVNGILVKCPKAPAMLTLEEIEVLQDITNILKPLEVATTDVSGDSYVTSSILIPLTRCILVTIEKCQPITRIGSTFKQNILKEFDKRFANIELSRILAIATLLDPRFKKIHFTNPRAVSSAIAHIHGMIRTNSEENAATDKESTQKNNPQCDSKSTVSLWNVHDNLVQEIAGKSDEAQDDSAGIDVELRQYLNQTVVSRTVDPIVHWKKLKFAYPKLFPIAMKYLSVVGTSVPAERLFSKAGMIKSNLRNRLTEKRLSVLLFLSSLGENYWNM